MTLYYIQINILCVIILVIVQTVLGIGKSAMSAQRIAFARLVFIGVVMCIADMMAWYWTGKLFYGAKALVYLSNSVYYLTITLAGYAWLKYVYLRIRGLEYDFKRFRRVALLPTALIVALLIINPFTGVLFTVDAANEYHRNSIGIIVHWVVSWGYLIYATFVVFRKMRESASRIERNQLIPMFIFILPPAVAAILQMIFYGVTTTQCGMTISILIIAIRFIMNEVSKDSLTGLNNRSALENYLIERLQWGPVEMSVLMCDVDKFKSINDTFGHAGGDLVLKRMAEELKGVCAGAGRKILLCRYGGDEFVICGTDIPGEELTNIRAAIERRFANITVEGRTDVTFSVSVGCATGVCKTYDDVEKLIARADSGMYSVKATRAL